MPGSCTRKTRNACGFSRDLLKIQVLARKGDWVVKLTRTPIRSHNSFRRCFTNGIRGDSGLELESSPSWPVQSLSLLQCCPLTNLRSMLRLGHRTLRPPHCRSGRKHASPQLLQDNVVQSTPDAINGHHFKNEEYWSLATVALGFLLLWALPRAPVNIKLDHPIEGSALML